MPKRRLCWRLLRGDINMAHLVFITGGLTGLFNASLALIQPLQQAGHRITFASPGDLRDRATAADLPYVQLPPWGKPVPDLPLSRWQKWRRLQERQQSALATLEMDRFVDALTGLNPDLLLIDIEMHEHIMTAVAHRWPVALLCLFFSFWQHPNLPPIHTGIVPGETLKGSQMGIWMSWLRYRWRKWKAFQRARWQTVGLDRQSLLRCYARQLEGANNKTVDSVRFNFNSKAWIIPFPCPDLPILSLSPLAIDFPHRPHPSMQYLGLMVAEDRPEIPLTSETPAILEALITKRQTNNRSGQGRPLIYCGCSSLTPANHQFLKTLFSVAEQCPEWDFVLGLGGKSPHGLGAPVLSNLTLLPWAPQLKLLEYADAAIINGGAHSIAECIYYGVPMLIYSLNRDDQNGNAARVQHHGLGLSGNLQQDTAAQVKKNLTCLLTDPAYGKRMHRLGAQQQHVTESRELVRIVEALLPSTNLVHQGAEV